jgi:hypothetical protein
MSAGKRSFCLVNKLMVIYGSKMLCIFIIGIFTAKSRPHRIHAAPRRLLPDLSCSDSISERFSNAREREMFTTSCKLTFRKFRCENEVALVA